MILSTVFIFYLLHYALNLVVDFKVMSSLPSVIDILNCASDTISVQAPPTSSYLKSAVGVTVPSFLSRSMLSVGIQVCNGEGMVVEFHSSGS